MPKVRNSESHRFNPVKDVLERESPLTSGKMQSEARQVEVVWERSPAPVKPSQLAFVVFLMHNCEASLNITHHHSKVDTF